MSSTRPTLVMCTAWCSYPPPAKVRLALLKKTSFSLLGAAMRLSRCVWLECATIPLEPGEDIVPLGLEVLAQRAGAPHYYRVHPRRRSLPRYARGSPVCRLPGRIRTRVGYADQDVHSDDHCPGGELSRHVIFCRCLSACVECGHPVAFYPRIRPLCLLRQWASQCDLSCSYYQHVY